MHEQEVVGRVKATEQALSLPPKHTQLQLASNPVNAVALEIRGDDVAYQFAPPRTAGQSENSATCENGGMQE